jgi:hypothetical protein
VQRLVVGAATMPITRGSLFAFRNLKTFGHSPA